MSSIPDRLFGPPRKLNDDTPIDERIVRLINLCGAKEYLRAMCHTTTKQTTTPYHSNRSFSHKNKQPLPEQPSGKIYAHSSKAEAGQGSSHHTVVGKKEDQRPAEPFERRNNNNRNGSATLMRREAFGFKDSSARPQQDQSNAASSSMKRKCESSSTPSIEDLDKRPRVERPAELSSNHRSITEVDREIFEEAVKISSEITAEESLSMHDSTNPMESDASKARPKIQAEEMGFVSKSSRTKVFSGSVKQREIVPKPTLFTLKEAQPQIEALKCPTDIPFDSLKPILRWAKPDQLAEIEYFNPQIIPFTETFWETFVLKEFNGERRQEKESWRDMYKRCKQEKDDKFQRLTEAIKLRHMVSTSAEVQKAKAVVSRKHSTKKTGGKPLQNSSRPNVSYARDHTPDSDDSLNSAVRPVAKPKAAPLMAKVISQYKRY